jgi:hypothetical protein
MEKLNRVGTNLDVVTTFEREAAAEGEEDANIKWFMEGYFFAVV